MPESPAPTYRVHIAWRGLALSGVLIFSLGFVAGLLAYRQETNPTGPWLMAAFVPLIALTSTMFAAWSSTVTLTTNGLIIARFGRLTYIPYQDIERTHLGEWITLHTRRNRYRLWFPLLNQMGRLLRDIEARCQPGGPDTLPIVLPNPKASIILLLAMGLLMLFIGLFGTWMTITEFTVLNFDTVTTILMLLLMFAVGAMLAGLSLFGYVWHHVFTPDEIQVRYVLRRKRYPAAAVTTIELRHEVRTYRGFSREVPVLRIHFTNEKPLDVAFSNGGYPMDYSPVYAEKTLTELSNALRRVYLP